MTVLGISEFGYVQAYLASGGGTYYDAQVNYTIDADNYIKMYLTRESTPPYSEFDNIAAIVGVVDGLPLFGADTNAYFSTPLITTSLGAIAVEFRVRETGQTKTIEIWSEAFTPPEAGPPPRILELAFAIPNFAGEGEWEIITGDSGAFTKVDPIANQSPNPPESAWADYKNETVLDGAYARVTLYDNSGNESEVYSSAADGDETLISLNLHEFFDPTTTKPQINSGSFSIHTPYDPSTPQSEIAAFLAKFKKNLALKVERGWMTESGGIESYDTVVMGYYFITEATIDKNTWVLNVEFHDIFGTLGETYYVESNHFGVDGALDNYMADVLAELFATSQAVLPTGVIPYSLDTAINGQLIMAPIPADKPALEIVRWITNLAGGRWYVTNTGIHTLVCTNKIATQDYKLNNIHYFERPPMAELWEGQVPTPYSVVQSAVVVDFTAETDIAAVPVFPSGSDYLVVHGLCADQKVYSRSGGVDTEIVDGILAAYDYATLLRDDIWIVSTSPLVRHEEIVIKGYAGEITAADSATTNNGSKVENPLVVLDVEAKGILGWAFPDHAARQYTFTVRDDPSLKPGNIIQIAVDNEYLNVVLVEVKRSFNGAGHAEWTGLYVSATGTEPFPTAVTNPVATLKDETHDTPGVIFTWDGVTGYDDWDNPDFFYYLYKTGDGPDTLIAGVNQNIATYETDDAVAEGDAFGIAVMVANYEWEPTPCTIVVFDNTDDSDRPAGTFVAGQARLY